MKTAVEVVLIFTTAAFVLWVIALMGWPAPKRFFASNAFATFITIVIVITAIGLSLAVSGCSSPSAGAIPDYHALLGAEHAPELKDAHIRCASLPTAADRAASTWCGVAHKADICNMARGSAHALGEAPPSEPNAQCPLK